MSTTNTIFLIQSRIGKALDIDFDLVRKMSNARLIVVGHDEVLAALKQMNELENLDGIIEVDRRYLFSDVVDKVVPWIQSDKIKNYKFATINESKNMLTESLNRHFGVSVMGVEKFVNKYKMKDFLKSKGLIDFNYKLIDKCRYMSDKDRYVEFLIKGLDFPLFIKPVDMYASKYCQKINTIDELVVYIERKVLVLDVEFQVESYIDGALYLCDSVVVKGKVVYSQVCEYTQPCVNIYTSACLGWISLPREDSTSMRIEALSRKANESMLENQSGVTHLEAFDDGYKSSFLEVAYRPIGVEPTQFYLKRASIPLREMHIALQVNEDLCVDIKEKYYVACFIINYPEHSGIVESISLPELKSQYKVQWNCKPKEKVCSNNGFDSYAATLVVWNEDYRVLRKDFDLLKTYRQYLIIENAHERIV